MGRFGRLGWIVVGLATLAGAAYVVGFVGYGATAGADDYLSGKPRATSCETPDSRFGWGYEAVNYPIADDAALLAANPDPTSCTNQGTEAGTDLVSPDGTHLAAWYVPSAAAQDRLAGSTGPTVVLVHGGKSNKSGMLDYAPAFHDAYNLLIVDLRNSGRSGGDRSTGGLLEQDDLRAFIEWLVRTKQPSWIAVMGNSNGAATALAEARNDSEIQALILDSMHATLESQLGNVIETERHLPAWPGAWGVMLGVQLRLGQPVEGVDPVVTIAQVRDRPLLLTHGSADVIDRPAESLDRNVAAAKAAGLDPEVHVCDGAGHGQVVLVCESDWTTWVRAFLAAASSGGASA